MPFWNKSRGAIDTARSDRSDATRRARRLVQSWASSTNTKASKDAISGLETRVGRAIRSALKRGRESRDSEWDRYLTNCLTPAAKKTAIARSDRSDATRRARRLVKSTGTLASRVAISDLETRVTRAIRSALSRARAS